MDTHGPRDAMTKTPEILSFGEDAYLRRFQRADGGFALGVVCTSGETRLSSLRQNAPCRVFFPSVSDRSIMEAIIVNTGGGLVEGDRLSTTITVGMGARMKVTTQAAGKIYRSLTETCAVSNDLRVSGDGLLIWRPQETILFDGARLPRQQVVFVEQKSRFLAAEVVIFGRIARDEILTHGQLRDSWSIHCDGKLLWMDCLRLEGDFAAHRARRFGFGDSIGLATVIYFGADAAHFLPYARQTASRIAGAPGSPRSGVYGW
ncbi:MAG: urease accessory protein UreD, partial [Chthoniobacterales bacterium]|nr:urease accessory protein UreD [Chthoniobacterales bacterium]